MNDLRGTLTSFTRNVTKTSGDLFKTTKLSVSLSQEQESLRTVYLDIGKKVHEIYMYGGTLGKFFDEKYHEIVACEQRINELKDKINQIKGTRECPNCGKTVEKTSEFCPKCGGKLDGTVRVSMVPDGMDSVPTTSDTRPHAPSAPPEAFAEPSESSSAFTTPVPEPAEPSPAVTAPAPEPVEPPPTPRRLCNICGAANDPETKFCLTCGRLL